MEGEKKAAATKNPAAQKPTEKKPTTEEKKPAHKLEFFFLFHEIQITLNS